MLIEASHLVQDTFKRLQYFLCQNIIKVQKNKKSQEKMIFKNLNNAIFQTFGRIPGRTVRADIRLDIRKIRMSLSNYPYNYGYPQKTALPYP